MNIFSLATILGLLSLSTLSSASQAAESSWFNTDGARIRLISLPAANGTQFNAGLQIELERGWKTYWRSPGASGLPPMLDFQGSQNLASTRVDYPVPTTFGDKTNLTAGYTGSVTFPITVEPLFANRPVALKLTGLVGICADVCIPVQFELSLLEDGKGLSKRDVAAALLQAQSRLVGKSSDQFYVRSARYDDTTLDVEAVLPSDDDASALMVEGPESWYLTPAQAYKTVGRTAHYKINLKDIPKQANPADTLLKFTVVSGNSGIEMSLKPVRH